ncbi:hypothetical protein QJQ45_012768 [Haematococcus lacustris]|nr:hypothetical protein QJQ45_012768 [Haematococcus lacustris]
MPCTLCALCAKQLADEAAIESKLSMHLAASPSIDRRPIDRRRNRTPPMPSSQAAFALARGVGGGPRPCCRPAARWWERPNSGKPTNRQPGKVVTVDEFRTSRVSSAMNSPQPCEELDRSKPTRLEGWKPQPGQVQNRMLWSAWSQRFEAPVRGFMWCPELDQATPGDIGKWVDRDCNAAFNLKRAREAPWSPLELCWWQHVVPQ